LNRWREFEYKMLRRIVRHEREEITGGWRDVHNEQLHNFYPLPNVIRVNKSENIRWAGHVGCTGGR
jgi:hypothetical protein